MQYDNLKWMNEDNTCEFNISVTEKGINISGIEYEDNEKFVISEICRRGRIIQFTSFLPSAKYIARNLLYIDERDVLFSETLSNDYWIKAESEDKRAQFEIGEFYYKFAGGLKENYKAAFDWYCRSAMNGNKNAQVQIGWMYWSGEGVRKSYKKAAYWYGRASNQGHPFAQYSLSVCYCLGRGVAKNEATAFYWAEKAALFEEPDAILALGWHYHNGIGTETDLSSARRWYLKSASINEPKAMFSLGQLSYDKNKFKSAKYWFLKASEYNHPRSYYYLGRMYLEGKGTSKDMLSAGICLEKAANLGIKAAKRLLDSKKFKAGQGGYGNARQ